MRALSAVPRRGILTGAVRLALAVPCPTCVNSGGAGVANPPFPPNARELFAGPLQGTELLLSFCLRGPRAASEPCLRQGGGEMVYQCLGCAGGGTATGLQG